MCIRDRKKVNLTGSVSTVNAEDLLSRPVSNVSQALQGLVPGMNFSYASDGNGGEIGADMKDVYKRQAIMFLISCTDKANR